MASVGKSAAVVSTRLIIGLEVHVELSTRSKMFSRAPNAGHPDNFDAPPNSLVDPLVLALPGTLPVMNRRAVELSAMVGLALGCSIARYSKWDRKNYFYPDLPKGYQISQYDLPLCGKGEYLLDMSDGSQRRIGITRAHLEEDTGKLGHELPGGHEYSGSLVDLNRAGTPLLEIVTEPDFACAEDVVAFAQELRDICRFLGATEGIMQKGHMRFEPNINLAISLDDGTEVRTPIVEVKNLNSFRAVKGAIEFEAKRQLEEWQKSGRAMGRGMKSTRGWDDVRLATVLQREKEDAHDYRYFPDPDLVPVVVDDAWIAARRAELVEGPSARRRRYGVEFGLSSSDVRQLLDDPALAKFFDLCVAEVHSVPARAMAVAKLLLNAGAKRANELGTSVTHLGIAPAQVVGLLALRESGTIGSQAVDPLFALLCASDGDAMRVAQDAGLLQVRDDSQLDGWVDAAIAANEAAANDVRAGKLAAIGRIVGAAMRSSGGKADAKALHARIVERLGEGGA